MSLGLPVGQQVKSPPAMQEIEGDMILFLNQEDPE